MKIAPNPQPDMFTAPMIQLGSRTSYLMYSDLKVWHIIMFLLARYPDTMIIYSMLKHLLDEQYEIKDGRIVLRDQKIIKADRLPYPNRLDKSFCDKHPQKEYRYVLKFQRLLFTLYEPLRNAFCWLKMIYTNDYSKTAICYISLGMLANDNTDCYCLN